ncbi:PRC-barrel domain-containing protein [Ectothiorhodospira lacustris]|uniref:PRC-barrel domain-containing protein n=1 Tax=Ectothiorhodospira lacustris TaxID=2899127 RepID=UPI001EE8B35C|nr:PRC-barrel domain-containing protein [Ectothiorhodospira lacustris]MCG5499910.1 PRC-barrel domain-containing protein [Ectothiorhodospira lacustris]MCG5508829.1 PRC-barrel domain-containing protein [Ectothiorhodospira lacustris]MCG5520620.1 PRC-barrel domain-containing protein [Ectothiorhodospira lacustris]
MNIRTHGGASSATYAQDALTDELLLSTHTLIGTEVVTRADEKLGSIKDFMMNTTSGSINYAVISAGGFLGIGDKLYAVPWDALSLDTRAKNFILDVDVEQFKAAPGFDKDDWPDMADATWAKNVRSHYGLGD